uniref:Guanine nucleotide-binding protein subunit alpha n=1 Tax=Seriola dumerili TaxID=41447 RepID=A0A3B4U2Q8_SERDU
MASCWQWCHRTCMCCLSEEEKRTIAVDKEIKRILKQQKKKERREIKILLLGTGESGKTTFIRQMRIIHGRGFSEEERKTFAKCIFQNILTAIKAMTGAMTMLKIPYSNPENEIFAKWLQDINTVQITQLERGYVDAIRRLWADPGIRVCYSRRCEYQLLDSTEYYMSNLDRISGQDYIPTEQDVLRVRFPTTGIHDYSFTIRTITLRWIVDVGGQKSERRKWIHCFENVTSLIFLASLSEYDQVLEERETINRMHESLALFYTTIHSPWFLNTSIILFLNKTDILADKIQTSDLQKYFPSFTGKRQDPEDAKNYIRKLYEQQAINRDKRDEWKTLYPHFTCATDTSNIRRVFSDVKDTVLLKSLRDYGVI